MGVCCAMARLGMIVGVYMVDKHFFFEYRFSKVLVGILTIAFSVLVTFFVPERSLIPLKMSIEEEVSEDDINGRIEHPAAVAGDTTVPAQTNLDEGLQMQNRV